MMQGGAEAKPTTSVTAAAKPTTVKKALSSSSSSAEDKKVPAKKASSANTASAAAKAAQEKESKEDDQPPEDINMSPEEAEEKLQELGIEGWTESFQTMMKSIKWQDKVECINTLSKKFEVCKVDNLETVSCFIFDLCTGIESRGGLGWCVGGLFGCANWKL